MHSAPSKKTATEMHARLVRAEFRPSYALIGLLVSKRSSPLHRHDHNKTLDEIQKGITIEW
jgi:hypothetical protein